MIYGGYFENSNIVNTINDLDNKTLEPNFYKDKISSEKIIQELNYLKKKYNDVVSSKEDIDNDIELIESLKENYDQEIFDLLINEVNKLDTIIDDLEVSQLLSKEYDSNDCILEIHPGAGGTESCDWANILLRMYTRYCEKHNYKMEVIDKEDGLETGIKSVSIIIRGSYAYGYLKSEKGIHRLIRISPFDSNKRRHTSFASIDITPMCEKNKIDIVIDEKDIRVDVYRSTGCGGQGVNTTDSAVRITHLPTKIVVTCQNERSQIQNKEKCMEVLRNKLYKLEIEKRNQEIKDLKGEMKEINFGSQIRTYTMHPYSLVKDHRSNKEEHDVIKVLDGNIDEFINAYLKI